MSFWSFMEPPETVKQTTKTHTNYQTPYYLCFRVLFNVFVLLDPIGPYWNRWVREGSSGAWGSLGGLWECPEGSDGSESGWKVLGGSRLEKCA